jgi:hypothetical protein
VRGRGLRISPAVRSIGVGNTPDHFWGRIGAATYAAYKQSLADGRVARHEKTVLFNCASGLKYPLPPIHRTLDRHKPIDFAAL